MDLTEHIERESSRIAAAFGVQKTICSDHGPFVSYEGVEPSTPIWWHIEKKSSLWIVITLGQQTGEEETDDSCQTYRNGYEKGCFVLWHHNHAEKMARGLFLLGISDGEIQRELGVVLSAHDKAELVTDFPPAFRAQHHLS